MNNINGNRRVRCKSHHTDQPQMFYSQPLRPSTGTEDKQHPQITLSNDIQPLSPFRHPFPLLDLEYDDLQMLSNRDGHQLALNNYWPQNTQNSEVVFHADRVWQQGKPTGAGVLTTEQIEDDDDEEFGSLVGLLRKGMQPEDEEDDVEPIGAFKAGQLVYGETQGNESDNSSRREDIEGSNQANDSDSSDLHKKFRDKFIIQNLVVPGHTIKHQNMLPTRNCSAKRPFMSTDFGINIKNRSNNFL